MNQSKGYITFDGLFSILPALLILIFTMNIANHLTDNANEHVFAQQRFDKLVSIADYTVKQGAVVVNDSTKLRYPNLINESKLTNDYIERLRVASNLNSLDITLDDPGAGSVCIYRIVLDQKDEIRQLHVCGS
jgi:hypothetical protein